VVASYKWEAYIGKFSIVVFVSLVYLQCVVLRLLANLTNFKRVYIYIYMTIGSSNVHLAATCHFLTDVGRGRKWKNRHPIDTHLHL